MPSKLELSDNNECFVCGKNNPIGMKLEFAIEGDEYVTHFTPRKEHQGWQGIVHGGIVSTVLDEIMGRYTHILGLHAVTAEITVRLKRPMRVEETYKITGRVDSEKGRVVHCSAQATDKDGQLIAEATAIMIKVA